jgi:hypothetical protein
MAINIWPSRYPRPRRFPDVPRGNFMIQRLADQSTFANEQRDQKFTIP